MISMVLFLERASNAGAVKSHSAGSAAVAISRPCRRIVLDRPQWTKEDTQSNYFATAAKALALRRCSRDMKT